MKIKDGGVTENTIGKKIEEIKFYQRDSYKFELWINNSVSYLDINEALQLRDEISKAIRQAVK